MIKASKQDWAIIAIIALFMLAWALILYYIITRRKLATQQPGNTVVPDTTTVTRGTTTGVTISKGLPDDGMYIPPTVVTPVVVPAIADKPLNTIIGNTQVIPVGKFFIAQNPG